MNPERIMQLAALVEDNAETLADRFDVAAVLGILMPDCPNAAHVLFDVIPTLALKPGWERAGYRIINRSYVYLLVSPTGDVFAGRSEETNRAVVAGLLRQRAFEEATKPRYSVEVVDGKLVKVEPADG